MSKTITKVKTQALRVGGQLALYIDIVEPDLYKTSLACRQVANFIYFFLLILHGPSTKQKKLSVAITTKEKPTPDVRADANKSRRILEFDPQLKANVLFWRFFFDLTRFWTKLDGTGVVFP